MIARTLCAVLLLAAAGARADSLLDLDRDYWRWRALEQPFPVSCP